MPKIVSTEGLADDIMEMIREYNEDVIRAIPGCVDQTAKEAAAELRSRSPRQTGSYAKGWRIKKVYSRSGFEGRVISNKTDYQLTHLLEFGHAKTGGGRVEGSPHVAPVAEEYGLKFTENLARIVVNGG